MHISEHFLGTLSVLLPAMDIVRGRVNSPEVPAWCETRAWTDFLLGLSEEELAQCERHGLAAWLEGVPRAPESLRELARQSLRWTAFPNAPEASLELEDTRHISQRKQHQLQVLLDAIEPMAKRARRMVDVGAGRGHFTRLAAQLFECTTLGLEREPERVLSAQRLGANTTAEFKTFDASREKLDPSADDLLIGLHACGELGDRMVAASCAAGCAMVLISCCLQKIEPGERQACSEIGKRAGFRLKKDDLGLSNLSARPKGVETPIEDTLRARQARHGLRLLLMERGLLITGGEEMRGINRRLAHKGLEALSRRACELWSLPAPDENEIQHYEERARIEYDRIRRISLPRSMLSKLMEASVVLDRAAALAEHGSRVRVLRLFSEEVSPRNLGILSEGPGMPPLHHGA